MHFIVSGPAILLLAFFIDAQALLWQHANKQAKKWAAYKCSVYGNYYSLNTAQSGPFLKEINARNGLCAFPFFAYRQVSFFHSSFGNIGNAKLSLQRPIGATCGSIFIELDIEKLYNLDAGENWQIARLIVVCFLILMMMSE